MPDLLTTLRTLINEVLALDDPQRPLPTVLSRANLGSMSAVELEPSAVGIQRWLDQLRSFVGDPAVRECLLVRVLQVKLPRLAEVLALAGVIRATWDGAILRSFTIDWGALEGFTKNPGPAALAALVGKVADVDDLKAMQVLVLLLVTGPDELVRQEYARRGFLALPAGDGVDLSDLTRLVNSPVQLPLGPLAVGQATLEQIEQLGPGAAGARVIVEGSASPSGLGELSAELVAKAEVLRSAQIDLWQSGWVLSADTSGSGEVSARIVLRPDGVATDAAARGSAKTSVFLSRRRPEGDDALLLGERRGTHFAIRDAKVGVTFFPDAAGPAFGFTLALDGVRFSVGTDVLGPLGGGLPLPSALRFDAPVSLSFLQGVPGLQGSSPDGGLTLALEVPRHLGFVVGGAGGGLWVDDMLVRVEAAVAQRRLALRVMFRFDARAELGPLKASVSGAGAWLGPWTSGAGGLVPPTGIGLSLDAGPISGGGFFGSLGAGEYGGALSLKVLGIGAFAYGIYKELPGGDVSFVAAIGVRLPFPGIQIGFGFAVSGIGGLIGINRRADLDLLRERLSTGTAGDVLFPGDPTKNAPRLLGQLRELFPDERGVHVFGPTLQLNWLSLIHLDVGVFIELPGPRKIFIAGTGRLVVGTEDFAIISLRLDFVGGIDLTASLIFFVGSLVNSHLLGILRITGGVALHLAYGTDGYFLYSVGGFHPDFAPAGLALPKLARAGASARIAIVWFSQQTYFAVTSNTVQFGARTEAGIEIGPIKVHGWFGFDALIQFRPFQFTAAIDAGMAAEFAGVEFASIRVRGELTGPSPIVLRAKASVKVLVTISKSVTITLGDPPREAIVTISNLATHLRDEIAKPANLRGAGDDPEVRFRQRPGGDTALIPTGDIVWEQRRVPLERELRKAEGNRLDPPRRLDVSVDGGGEEPEEDQFGVGTYADVTDAQALSGPTFSTGRSGFRLGLSGRFASPTGPGARADQPSEASLIVLPRRNRLAISAAIRYAPGLLEAAGERAAGAAVKTQAPHVRVREEKWQLVDGPAMHAADAFLSGLNTGKAAFPVSTPTVSLQGVL